MFMLKYKYGTNVFNMQQNTDKDVTLNFNVMEAQQINIKFMDFSEEDFKGTQLLKQDMYYGKG